MPRKCPSCGTTNRGFGKCRVCSYPLGKPEKIITEDVLTEEPEVTEEDTEYLPPSQMPEDETKIDAIVTEE